MVEHGGNIINSHSIVVHGVLAEAIIKQQFQGVSKTMLRRRMGSGPAIDLRMLPVFNIPLVGHVMVRFVRSCWLTMFVKNNCLAIDQCVANQVCLVFPSGAKQHFV